MARSAAGAALVLGLGVVPLAGTAWAADPCTAADSAGVVTCSYAFTGAEQTFTVPAGVTQVQIVAVGAAGGLGEANSAQIFGDTPVSVSQGAQVGGTVAGLTSGQALYVEVGGAATAGSPCVGTVACLGGFNGGGSSLRGGGGGGASDVRSQSSTVAGSLTSRLLVAGGGGGSGGSAQRCDPHPAPGSLEGSGGLGGDAGAAGARGNTCPNSLGVPSTGGGAGTDSAGGAGGTTFGGPILITGAAGAAGSGGTTTASGGGGGGGLYGGGSGAAIGSATGNGRDLVAAGGGGGGSSLVPAGGFVAVSSAPASVTITYTIPDSTPPVIAPTVSGTLSSSGWYTSDVGVAWSVTDPDSAISSSTGCDPSTVSTDTTGVTFTCTAASLGGTASNAVTVKRDTAGPVLSITGGPVDAGSYPSGAVPAAPSCIPTDSVSGPGSQPCIITGYATETGPHTLTFAATDVAGNTTTATRSYTVLAPVPGAITATSGGGQSATAGSTFAAPLVATVTDTTSAPLPGAPVTFTVTAGSVSFPGGATTAQVTTDAAGHATSPAIAAGATAGPATIAASTPGVTGTVSFTETVTAARADLSAALSAPASAAKGSSFAVVLTISNAGPSAATTIASGITLPSGLTITNGGGGAVTANKQSVGFLATALAPGASVTYTVTVKATTKGPQTITGGVLSVRTLDPQLANNVRTVHTAIN